MELVADKKAVVAGSITSCVEVVKYYYGGGDKFFHYLIPATINNTTTGYFIVDTGASMTALNSKLLGVQGVNAPVESTEDLVSTYLDESPLNKVSCAFQLSRDGKTYPMGMLVLDMEFLQGSYAEKEVTILGLLGADFLNKEVLLFDFKAPKLYLKD